MTRGFHGPRGKPRIRDLAREITVSITSYPAAYPEGFVINGPDGAEYRSLTYGVGFVEKEGTPPVGCVCLCVGCP